MAAGGIASVDRLHEDFLHAGDWRTLSGADHVAIGAIRGHAFGVARQAPVRIDKDPGRIAPCDPPHGERGIICNDGSHSHENRVHMCSQAMKVIERTAAIDVAGGARGGCDPAIEGLAKLRHHERPVDGGVPEMRQRICNHAAL